MYIHVKFENDEYSPPRFSLNDGPACEHGSISLPLSWFPHIQQIAQDRFIYGFVSSVENLIEGELPLFFTDMDSLLDYVNDILEKTGALIKNTGLTDTREGRYFAQSPTLTPQIKNILEQGGGFTIVCPDEMCYGHIVPFKLNCRHDVDGRRALIKDVDFTAL